MLVKRVFFLWTLVVGAACTAQLGAVVDGDRSPCELGADCPDSGICFNGSCTASCTASEDCEEGEYCAPDGLGVAEAERRFLRKASSPELASYIALARPALLGPPTLDIGDEG